MPLRLSSEYIKEMADKGNKSGPFIKKDGSIFVENCTACHRERTFLDDSSNCNQMIADSWVMIRSTKKFT